MKPTYKFTFLLVPLFFVHSCATLKKQLKEDTQMSYPSSKSIAHSFYLIGDAGNSSPNDTDAAIAKFQKELNKASKHSTAIFLGDNIYPSGMTNKDTESESLAKHRLKVQTDAVKNFKGNTVFIPGNHDWYSGLKGLKRQEKFIEKAIGKNSFLPENGCPIERVKISEDIVLLVVDSHWYITNWDKNPTINDNCDIKTRVGFLDELTSQVKKQEVKQR